MQITRVSLEKNKNLKAKMNISVEELEDNFKEISQKVEQKDQEMEKKREKICKSKGTQKAKHPNKRNSGKTEQRKYQ